MLLQVEIPVATNVSPVGGGRWAATSSRFAGVACVGDSPAEAQTRLKGELEARLMVAILEASGDTVELDPN